MSIFLDEEVADALLRQFCYVHFQKPYSFEAQSEPTIEIVDTAIVLDIASKPAVRHQLGRATLTRESSGARHTSFSDGFNS